MTESKLTHKEFKKNQEEDEKARELYKQSLLEDKYNLMIHLPKELCNEASNQQKIIVSDIKFTSFEPVDVKGAVLLSLDEENLSGYKLEEWRFGYYPTENGKMKTIKKYRIIDYIYSIHWTQFYGFGLTHIPQPKQNTKTVPTTATSNRFKYAKEREKCKEAEETIKKELNNLMYKKLQKYLLVMGKLRFDVVEY